MIKAVVFDLDHTLFDRHATLLACVPLMRERFSISEGVSDEEFAREWIYADDHFVYDGWKYIYAYLCEKGLFETEPGFDEYRSFVYYAFDKIAVPFPETLPMLRELKKAGCKTGLITNGSHNLQYRKIGLVGIESELDEIIVSGDFTCDKPDKEIFTAMAARLGVAPEECVYVGDNPVNDIDGARRAGYKTIWMKSTGTWNYRIARADREADRVEDIPRLAAELQK